MNFYCDMAIGWSLQMKSENCPGTVACHSMSMIQVHRFVVYFLAFLNNDKPLQTLRLLLGQHSSLLFGCHEVLIYWLFDSMIKNRIGFNWIG